MPNNLISAGAFTHIYAAAASLVLPLLTLHFLAAFFSKGTEEPYIYTVSAYR